MIHNTGTIYTPTFGSPTRVPPQRIPAHYVKEVEQQIEEMLAQGVIEESSSIWKTGELHLCFDYRKLNKKIMKDAYMLLLLDEVQDRLARAKIFTTFDLQCEYWQMPMNPSNCKKTVFCPGPGMGLFQFCHMSFRLIGAPSSFQ